VNEWCEKTCKNSARSCRQEFMFTPSVEASPSATLAIPLAALYAEPAPRRTERKGEPDGNGLAHLRAVPCVAPIEQHAAAQGALRPAVISQSDFSHSSGVCTLVGRLFRTSSRQPKAAIFYAHRILGCLL